MSPLAIVYYSFTGNNRLLASELSKRLDCPIFEVTPIKNRSKASIMWDLLLNRQPQIAPIELPNRRHHVIFIGPLWDSTVAHPLQSAIRQVQQREGAYSFVTLCGGERPKQPDKIRSKLNECAGNVEPRHVWELHVADLLAPHNGAASIKSSNTQVSPEDLATFETQIAEIVTTLQAEV